MNDVMVETRDLTKVFQTRHGEIRAVDDLSFSCTSGEIFGLLGPNGAGKTTTLRTLATILTPTSGSAIVAGFDTRSEPGRVRERIGFLAAETGLYDRFTARETLRFFGRITKMPQEEIDRRSAEIFTMLDLSGLEDRRVGTFSTGEKQKLSLARCILHDPPVLILDEPTFGLDVMAARAVLDAIRRLRQQGRTILLSTHIMRVAEKLCDRIGILYGGQLLALGTLPELQQRFPGEDLEDVFFAAVGVERAG
ncbi:MAG TPA: ABC transporter ATP-binding protein [Candidatus Heimdallarchaeota archaeon]|nr:ABC transporter ATP-binding protein [Candidatus Heimdallarchaeota archaeon]